MRLPDRSFFKDVLVLIFIDAKFYTDWRPGSKPVTLTQTNLILYKL